MAERLPPGVYDSESIKLAYLPNGLDQNGMHYPDLNGDRHSRSDSITSTGTDSAMLNGSHSLYSPRDSTATSEINMPQQREHLTPNGAVDHTDVKHSNGGNCTGSSVSEALDAKDSGSFQDGENDMRSRSPALAGTNTQVEAEWIEQYEPGVYITLVALRDGARDLKRVRFRYHLFLLHRILKCNDCNFAHYLSKERSPMISVVDLKSFIKQNAFYIPRPMKVVIVL